MQTARRVFQQPLLDRAKTAKKVLTLSEIEGIFSNLSELIALSERLCGALAEWERQYLSRDGRGVKKGGFKALTIAEIIERMCPELKAFSRFCDNYFYALHFLSKKRAQDKSFAEFLAAASQDPECKGADLSHFLIMPIQRVPRYVLLMAELLKMTPEAHPERRSISQCLTALKAMTDYINERVRTSEDIKRLVELQEGVTGVDLFEPYRRFIKQGELVKVSSRASQRRVYLLFSDALLYFAPKNLSGMEWRGTVPLGNTWVRTELDSKKPAAPSKKGAKPVFYLSEMMNKKKTYTIVASSEAEKSEWVEAIEDAVEAYCHLHPDCPRAAAARNGTGPPLPPPKQKRSFVSFFSSANPAELDPNAYFAEAEREREELAREGQEARKARMRTMTVGGTALAPSEFAPGAPALAPALAPAAASAAATTTSVPFAVRVGQVLASGDDDEERERKLIAMRQKDRRSRSGTVSAADDKALTEFQRKFGYISASSASASEDPAAYESDGGGPGAARRGGGPSSAALVSELQQEVASLRNRVVELEGEAGLAATELSQARKAREKLEAQLKSLPDFERAAKAQLARIRSLEAEVEKLAAERDVKASEAGAMRQLAESERVRAASLSAKARDRDAVLIENDRLKADVLSLRAALHEATARTEGQKDALTTAVAAINSQWQRRYQDLLEEVRHENREATHAFSAGSISASGPPSFSSPRASRGGGGGPWMVIEKN